MNNNLVFVYGTLRTGYANHHLLYNAVSLGNGWTVSDDFVMKALRTPYVSAANGRVHECTKIYGELYALSDAELQRIDEHEEKNNLHRIRIEVDVVGNGSEYAWMYINNDQTEGYVITSGNYSDFKNPGEA